MFVDPDDLWSLFFAGLSLIWCGFIGEFVKLVYIRAMSLLKSVICVLLVLSLVGCAVSRNPNPVIRYGANTGATMAVPGMAGLVVIGAWAAALDEDDDGDIDDCDSKCSESFLTGIGITAGTALAGFVVGALLGGTVGFFKWMFNGFQDDVMEPAPDSQENVLPLEKKTKP